MIVLPGSIWFLSDQSSLVFHGYAYEQTSFTYNAERVLGSGSFGVVYQAQASLLGTKLATKPVRPLMPGCSLQCWAKELRHPNVVELKHAFYTSGEKPGETYLNAKCSAEKQEICHRDIKPQNLLVEGHTHALKLCDFGSAKPLVRGEPNVAYICSRYYRAPELIFGATDYGFVIDIWSAACVSAELILGHPMFPGESGVDQLVEIIKVLGTPTREELMAMNPNYTEFKFPQIKPHPWHKVFRSRTSQEAQIGQRHYAQMVLMASDMLVTSQANVK
eukprot:Skav227801  [mRNA]  locus=scaffold948:65235:71123:+ [translate_table: standard]